MRTARNIAMAGLMSLAAAIGTLTLPFSQPAGAMSVENIKEPQKSISLQSEENTAVDVTTELNCTTHTLTAQVKNKTNTKITPNVTFNEKMPTIPSTFPIEPGESGSYFYNYSGNNLMVEMKVDVDTYDPVTILPMLYCNEPVSFNVSESSTSAVVGQLHNNSTLVPQVVYTHVMGSDVRVETLMPGETRTVALPFKSMEGQVNTMVTIATSAGYESNYTVEIGKMTMPEPPVPLEK